MATTMIVDLRPKSFEEFLAWVKVTLADTLAFPGCEWVTFHTDDDDAGRLVLLERWASREHQGKYFAWRTEQGVMDEMASLLAEPLTVRWLSDLDV